MRRLNRKQQTKQPIRKRKNPDAGVRFRISPHPPSFDAIPWNNLTVRITGASTPITTLTLQVAIAQQLGITFTAGQTNVRLQSVRVWGQLVATGQLQPLAVTVFDPLAAVFSSSPATTPPTRVLEVLQDFPDYVSRACVAYKYPKAQRELSLFIQGTGAQNASLLAASGLGVDSVIYFNVHWRPANTTTPIPDPITTPNYGTFKGSEDDQDYVDISRIMRKKMVLTDDGRISDAWTEHLRIRDSS